MTQSEQLLALMRLFQGNSRWRGYHGSQLTPEIDDPGKVNDVRRGFLPGPVEEQHWLAHLKGEEGIGIVPINDYQECSFMAIDIDLALMEHLNITLTGVVEKITLLALPFVVCRSKSGGCHLYVFFKELVPVDHVRPTLVTIADLLGLRGPDGTPVEIYPHTSSLDIESKGKYINMPYFDAANGTKRFAYSPTATTLSLTDFILLAQKMSVSKKDFIHWSPPMSGDETIRAIMLQGPPCLQAIYDMGISQLRNDTLLQFAILYKKALGKDKFEAATEWVNNNRTNGNPIPPSDLASSCRGVRKSSYHYQCKSPCLIKYCNKEVCSTRKYGVANGAAGFPAIREVLQYGDENQTFEIHFEEGAKILRISASDLLNFDRVQADMLQLHHTVLPLMKKQDWHEFVKELTKKIRKIIVPQEFGIEARLRAVIIRMATSRAVGTKMEDLLAKKPVRDGKRILIAYKELQQEIAKFRWQDYLPGLELPVIINELKGGFETVVVAGEKMGVIFIPDPGMDQAEIVEMIKTDFKGAM